MKRFVALFIGMLLVFLCACEDEKPKNDNVSYVHINDYTGIPRETKTDWFEDETVGESANAGETSTGEKATSSVKITADDLPDGFPEIPEGTSNISMVRYSKEESKAGYRSDWIEVKFSAPEHSIIKFSQDLIAAGYKGGIRYVETEDGIYEYYGNGWHGGWQNGKHIISVLKSEKEIDGSFALTLHIAECGRSVYPEFGQYFPEFNGQSLTNGKYYEVLSNGSTVKHEFDGSFHEKWQLIYAFEEAFMGVSTSQFDAYVKTLRDAGFVGQTVIYRLDGCSTKMFDGINSEKGLYISMIHNENIQNINVVFTNDGINFGVSQ